MRRVRAFASNGDSKAEGIANGLVHAIYAAMDLFYGRILEVEIQDETLTFETYDDFTLYFRYQRMIVEKCFSS